eukprot:55242-Hanusia_phi.AAC.1
MLRRTIAWRIPSLSLLRSWSATPPSPLPSFSSQLSLSPRLSSSPPAEFRHFAIAACFIHSADRKYLQERFDLETCRHPYIPLTETREIRNFLPSLRNLYRYL